MPKSIVLLDISYINDKVRSLLTELGRDSSFLKIVSYSKPVLDKVKSFMGDDVDAVWSQDLFTYEDFDNIDKASYGIIRNWYTDNTIPVFKNKLSYKGIELGVSSEYALSLVIPQLLKKLALVKEMILREEPQKIIFISNYPEFNDLVEIVNSQLNRSIEVHNIILESGSRKKNGQIRRGMILLLSEIMGTFFSRPGTARKQEDKKRVLLFHGGRRIADSLDTAVFSPFLLDELFDKHGFSYSRKEKIPYYLAKNISSPFARRAAKKSMLSLWKRLEDDEEFKKVFSFDGIVFWPLIKNDIENIFNNIFPRQIEFIDNVRRILKKVNPALIVSSPGISSCERILFKAADAFKIPTLDIQHGLMGDKGARQKVHARYMAVWGEGTKNILLDWGNSKKEVFVTGNARFDKLVKRDRYETKESICDSLNLDTRKGIFVLATGVYTADPLPFFSSFWAKDEGEIMFRSVLKVMKEFPDKQLVVKLHPMEDNSIYLDVMSEFTNLSDRVYVVKQTNVYALLKQCDLLFTRGSTIAMEAMFFSKPVLILNFTKNMVSRYIPCAEYGSAIEVYDEDELAPAISKVLTDQNFIRHMKGAQDRFIRDFAGNLDGRNSERLNTLLTAIS